MTAVAVRLRVDLLGETRLRTPKLSSLVLAFVEAFCKVLDYHEPIIRYAITQTLDLRSWMSKTINLRAGRFQRSASLSVNKAVFWYT